MTEQLLRERNGNCKQVKKMKIAELESLLGPEDLDVDFRRIIEARDKKRLRDI